MTDELLGWVRSGERVVMTQVPKKLPPDVIVVQGGRVVSLREWCDWNGSHEIVLDARKEPSGGYSVFPYDPEHGGTTTQRGGTMFEAAEKALHPDVAKKLAELFDLENPTEKQIRQRHYRKGSGLKIVFQ